MESDGNPSQNGKGTGRICWPDLKQWNPVSAPGLTLHLPGLLFPVYKTDFLTTDQMQGARFGTQESS